MPVLVELFTSEGCSSCPPADELLAALQKQQPVSQANIIVLEEHVDYWDRLGWRDRFSSAQFTQRQNAYAPRLRFDDPYTPQMVVDGKIQFVGSDSAKAIASITQASRDAKIDLSITQPTIDGRQLVGSVSSVSNKADLSHGDLYAVLVDSSASTEVRAGENGGRHLEHVNVARTFERIGSLQELAGKAVSFRLDLPPGDHSEDMRLVVFAQSPDQGPIRGIVETESLPSGTRTFASAPSGKHLE
jgi:hypothetical protein